MKNWIIYISYALGPQTKVFNFKGSKTDLMTLIGCIVSTSIEQVRVSYKEVSKPDYKRGVIAFSITAEDRVIIYKEVIK